MNLLDILILIPFAWMIFRGFTRGLILMLTSLIALFAGIFLAVHFSGIVAGWLGTTVGMKSEYLNVIAFAITFFMAVIVVQVVGYLVHSVAKMVALGFLNRMAGAALGFIKAALFTGTVLFIINSFDTNQMILSERMRSESRLVEPLSRVIPAIWPRMQEWIRGPGGIQKIKPEQAFVISRVPPGSPIKHLFLDYCHSR